jgi:hypothetical protein
MKSFAATTSSAPASSEPSTILSLFKKSKKHSPSSSAGERRTPPSPSHSSSSSTETLDIQLTFDLHSTPISSYTPHSFESDSAPPAYSAGAGKEEDLEVVEKPVQMGAEEVKRQRKAMKLLEKDRRMSEALKGLGF